MVHGSRATVRGVSANKSSFVVGSDLFEDDVVEDVVFQLPIATPHTQSEDHICPVCSVLPFHEVHSRSISGVIEHCVDITTLDQNLLMRRYDACGLCELIVDLIRAWASGTYCSSLRFPYKGRNYFWACCNRSLSSSFTGRWKICVESSSILSQRIRSRPLHSEPLSQTSVTQISGWLKECQAEHASCQKRCNTLPTRILDVGKDGDYIRLIDTAGGDGEYIALSHCWGQVNSFTTTKATLNARLTGFKIDQLPSTFRHAVLVTRAIDVRYLWIDSLCIVQDDMEDWQFESSKMAAVYGNALCTVAASNAVGDEEGFLKLRRTKYIHVELSNASDRMVDLYLEEDATADPSPESEPLEKRAWTLQERYLSSRIILFGSSAFRWECRESAWHERGPGFEWIPVRLDDLLPPRFSMGIAFNSWYRLIEQYSSRSLTFERDRLPALSALAAYVSSATKASYIAGIWWTSEDIVMGLLWAKSDRTKGTMTNWLDRMDSITNHIIDKSPQLKSGIAPSWSWASYPAPVQFPDISLYECLRVFQIAQFSRCRILPMGKNPYGEVQHGSILLRAPLLQLPPIHSISPPATGLWETIVSFGPRGMSIKKQLIMNADRVYGLQGQLYALPLVIWTYVIPTGLVEPQIDDDDGEIVKLLGLIVRFKVWDLEMAHDKTTMAYERVGCFFVNFEQSDSASNILKCLRTHERQITLF